MVLGAAHIDERGKVSGGKLGDQKQTVATGESDYKGEVSYRKFYVHKKGWYILEPLDPKIGKLIARACKGYCKDKNVGYDQDNRSLIMKYDGKGKTACDCSSLVRRCIKDATGKDVGNFTTLNEREILLKSGFFKDGGKYKDGMKLKLGTVLVTCTKGHTEIVVSV